MNFNAPSQHEVSNMIVDTEGNAEDPEGPLPTHGDEGLQQHQVVLEIGDFVWGQSIPHEDFRCIKSNLSIFFSQYS